MSVNSIIIITRKPAKKIIFRVLNVFFAPGLEGVKINVNTRKLIKLITRYVVRSPCLKKAKRVFTRHEIHTRKNTYLLYILKAAPREWLCLTAFQDFLQISWLVYRELHWKWPQLLTQSDFPYTDNTGCLRLPVSDYLPQHTFCRQPEWPMQNQRYPVPPGGYN